MQQEETETQVTKVTTVTPVPVGTEPPKKVYQTKKAIFRTYQVVWYILGVIETLLVFRFVLKMIGANSSSGFTSLIYVLSDPFAVPFSGVLRVSTTEGSLFEWSTIIAGVVYLIVAYGIVELLQLIKPTNRSEVEQAVDN